MLTTPHASARTRILHLSLAACLVGAVACGDDEGATSTGSTQNNSTTTGGGAAGGAGNVGGAGSGGEVGQGGFGGIPEDTGDWTCLGNVTYPPPTAANVTLNLTAVVITNGGPLEGLAVAACPAGDPSCASPVTTATTDARGQASLVVPTGTVGFEGFFRATGSSIPDSYLYPFPPVAADVENLELQVIDNGAMTLLSTLYGVDPDPARGHIGVLIQDCALEEAAAMTVSVDTADGETQTLYVNGSLPDATAQTTDESGVASMFNIPPGAAQVTATRATTNEVIGTVTVNVAAGSVTYAQLPPTP